MKIDVLTLFPGICDGALAESMIGRARRRGLVDLNFHDIRDWAENKHRRVDDAPFGGGAGMVMTPGPAVRAVEAVAKPGAHVVFLTPQGAPFDQAAARRLANDEHLVLLCGHYEGIDHRVVDLCVDEELSIGDYVLTNGALAAAVVIDAVTRLLPGVLGDERSAIDESFADGLLEAPHYTRPAEFRDLRVPEVLLGGHHGEIEKWRHQQAIERTRAMRPDLYQKWLADQAANTSASPDNP